MGDEAKVSTLPYAAEYAKSGRALCKKCMSAISQGSLRLAVREQSRFFDGMEDKWYHPRCFWPLIKKKNKEINESSIRGMNWLKWEDQEKIREEIGKTSGGAALVGNKEEKEPARMEWSLVKFEYAKTDRGKCTECNQKVEKGTPKYWLVTGWHHLQCLVKKYGKIEGDNTQIKGYDSLKDEDKKLVKEASKSEKEAEKEKAAKRALKEAEEGPPEKKKGKKEPTEDEELKAKLKVQSELQWEVRNVLKEALTKRDLADLLTVNAMTIPVGEERMLDRLVDSVLFGKPVSCPKCPEGELVFSSTQQSYMCLGNLSEWTKCSYQNKQPERTPLIFPHDMLEAFPKLSEVKLGQLTERVYPKQEEVVTKAMSRFAANPKSFVSKTTKSTHIVKKGTVVDGEFEMADSCHVYKDNKGVLYTVALSAADMSSNRNSYYKMQLLRHDTDKNQYYLFRSWGRVGTTIGGDKTDDYEGNEGIADAREEFERLFLEKTGNEWKDKANFQKKPGRMCMLEMDYSELAEKDDEKSQVKSGSKTKLHKAIQDLIMLIFDVEQMKTALKSFELDMNQMPLGKLSKKQLTTAYAVLTELQSLMEAGSTSSDKIVDASNRFYSLVPHNWGMRQPDKLDNMEIIQAKSKLLDDLMDIAVAVNLMKDEEKDKMKSGMVEVDPIDQHYLKLKSEIAIVAAKSPEYGLIQKYLKNTHGETHNTKLDIVQLYRVSREGEADRFKKDLGNRMLLWHGSGVANFVGIISQGLRIAPPEAPHAGYMFGKGIYFADMVSKSAGYCRAEQNGIAILLLCDVALGKVEDHLKATQTMPLKKGSHCCKGVGQSFPDPEDYYDHPDGYRIPYGKPVKKSLHNLLYNEFVVYDVAQVQIKYLVRCKMSYGW